VGRLSGGPHVGLWQILLQKSAAPMGARQSSG
jgi:hypothetical protein